MKQTRIDIARPGSSPQALAGRSFRWLLLFACLAADQATKYAARAAYSLPGGEPDYSKVTQVIGEWVQFRLVYNHGAAFGTKPQSVFPFLHPTLFFLVFSAVAILVLLLYYRKLGPTEGWQKTGVALILSGAFGNLIDRALMHKVTDFIDVGIPGLSLRWPTFNIADSCVCVGVGLILLAPLFLRKGGDGGPDDPRSHPSAGPGSTTRHPHPEQAPAHPPLSDSSAP